MGRRRKRRRETRGSRKDRLVTKWVKVAKREEEKEDAEAEEKKFEAIKRVPYGTKSTTKERTE